MLMDLLWKKNGESYYKTGDTMVGYRYFNYCINDKKLTVYALLKSFGKDIETEQQGLTSINMSIMNYRDSLMLLFQEI